VACNGSVSAVAAVLRGVSASRHALFRLAKYKNAILFVPNAGYRPLQVERTSRRDRPALGQSRDGGVREFRQNIWYVAAWSNEVLAGQLFHRTYLDEPILIFRKADGTAVALVIVARHRFAPLHMGKLVGETSNVLITG